MQSIAFMRKFNKLVGQPFDVETIYPVTCDQDSVFMQVIVHCEPREPIEGKIQIWSCKDCDVPDLIFRVPISGTRTRPFIKGACWPTKGQSINLDDNYTWRETCHLDCDTGQNIIIEKFRIFK